MNGGIPLVLKEYDLGSLVLPKETSELLQGKLFFVLWGLNCFKQNCFYRRCDVVCIDLATGEMVVVGDLEKCDKWQGC